MMRFEKLLLLIFWGFSLTAVGQSVGINTPTPDPSSVLDVQSTTKGVLIPRLTTSQRTAIVNPSEGLQIYNTDLKCFEFFDGTQWKNYGCCSPQASVPTSVSATLVGATGASVSFSGGYGTTYTVYSNPGGISASGSSSPIAVTGLQPSTNYTFTVVAQTTCGTSATSTSSNSITTLLYTPGSVTFNTQTNVQTFTVPAGVTSIQIIAVGAKGGDNFANNAVGGNGAKMEGTFAVTPGEQLSVVAGGMGLRGTGSITGGGGGGGSFVYRTSSNTLLIAAGGGGGANYTSGSNGQPANTTTLGGAGAYNTQPAGNGGFTDNGLGGGAGAGGGGWLSSGLSNSWCSGGALRGGAGGNGTNSANGGYGGGGGAYHGGGGGGGYSGGNGGYPGSSPTSGGGGSYNIGTNQNNVSGVGTSNGYVTITW